MIADTSERGSAMDRIRVKQFLWELTRWAAGQADIQAVALVGSHARGTATETSDVDLVVIANQPQMYLLERTWTHAFGEVVNEQVEEYGRLVSLRVRYANGLEVEYGLTDPSWADIPLDDGTRQVISGGMRVLFERRPRSSANN
jgi:predicted nucleotidyltransferase